MAVDHLHGNVFSKCCKLMLFDEFVCLQIIDTSVFPLNIDSTQSCTKLFSSCFKCQSDKF